MNSQHNTSRLAVNENIVNDQLAQLLVVMSSASGVMGLYTIISIYVYLLIFISSLALVTQDITLWGYIATCIIMS